jgi:hypothetical protein
MVTEQWGVEGPIRHPGTIRYAGRGPSEILIDLSALPKGATVYRARLFFADVNWKENGFDIVPAVREGEGDAAELKAAGEPLALVGPRYEWLDATDAVRAWAKAGAKTGRLWLRKARSFDRGRTRLEIAYVGTPPDDLPKQVSGVRALYRSGQVFVTFREVDPPDGGKDDVTVGELAAKMDAGYYRPRPRSPLRFRVYRHTRPITAETIGQAKLLGVARPGSAYNTRHGEQKFRGRVTLPTVRFRTKGKYADAAGVRVAAEPGKPLSAGTGIYVHTVRKPGKAYFAVLTARHGAVNARDIGDDNTAGPVDARVADPAPVLYRDLVTLVGRDGPAFHEQWYAFWTVSPLSPWPARYDVVVTSCPKLLAKPAPLHIHRNGWNSYPRPPRPYRTSGLAMTHTADQPVDFRMGLHDSIGTLKGFDQGTWRPFFTRRQDALVRWMKARWPVDANRISVGMAAWGMMEIKRGDVYARISGWGEPELTKGFQCWNRACGIWGTPQMYAGRPDDENPYVACNITRWVLEHPETELPFANIHARGGAHFTEMGWPPFPRFFWAMMKTKRAFIFTNAKAPVEDAIRAGKIRIRRNESLPAFAHCTLDDNVGDGDIHSGHGWKSSQINGYVLWDSDSIEDRADRWAITVWIAPAARESDCTVDLTPRRCQAFRPKPGDTFRWTNRPVKADQALQSGEVEADRWGLVTLKAVRVTKQKHQIVISK